MVKKIKDAFPKPPQNEDDLVTVSDELWELGSIGEIKEKVSHELFIAHIGMNIIGNHQCDGWGNILCYYPEILPYVPQALDALSLHEIKKEFQRVVAALPGFATDHPTKALYKHIEPLDNLSDIEWGLDAPQNGWGSVIKYINDNYSS